MVLTMRLIFRPRFSFQSQRLIKTESTLILRMEGHFTVKEPPFRLLIF